MLLTQMQKDSYSIQLLILPENLEPQDIIHDLDIIKIVFETIVMFVFLHFVYYCIKTCFLNYTKVIL